MIFNQNNDLDPVEIVEEEATQTETPPDNGWNPPLLNKFPQQSSPPIESPNAPDSHPPGVCEDVSDAARLASVVDLPCESLMDANEKILGVYQNWVHQNPGAYLDGGIEEDSKCQERWKNGYYAHPTL